MTDLPAGWHWTTLGELAADEPRSITDGPFGSNLTSAHYTDSGARVIRLQNIGDGVFREAAAYISLEHFETLRKHEVRAGDLLVASLGDNLPRACLMPEIGERAIVKADCIRIRLCSDVDSRWVLLALQRQEVKRWAEGAARGVGRRRLGLKAIRSIPIPLAPHAVQSRLVRAVEGYTSGLDAADDYLRSAKRRVGPLESAHLAASVSSASLVALGDLLAEPLANGRSVPDGTGPMVLRLTALRNETVEILSAKRGRWNESEAEKFEIRKDDLLVARGNGSLRLVGRAAIVACKPPRVSFPDTMMRIRADRNLVNPLFLLAMWNSGSVRRQIESLVRTTAGIYKINQNHLLSVKVPVVDRALQDQFVQDHEEWGASHRRFESGVELAETRSLALRRSLLDAAFSGRL